MSKTGLLLSVAALCVAAFATTLHAQKPTQQQEKATPQFSPNVLQSRPIIPQPPVPDIPKRTIEVKTKQIQKLGTSGAMTECSTSCLMAKDECDRIMFNAPGWNRMLECLNVANRNTLCNAILSGCQKQCQKGTRAEDRMNR